MRSTRLSLLSLPVVLGLTSGVAADDLNRESFVETLGLRIQAKKSGSVPEETVRKCEAGDAPSCAFLGEFYRERGKTVLAKRFHRKGCRGRHVPSCMTLGSIYLFDEDDRTRAAEAFRVPCEEGEAAGCHNLGDLARLEGDLPAARSYYEKACALGFDRSCQDLATLGP